MPIELKMPALSPTMEEGTLAKWLVKEGDEIVSGDIMAEIETDKATMEFEAVDEGVLAKILVPEGTDEVQVGAVIAIIAEEGEDASAIEAPAQANGSAEAAPAEKPSPPRPPAPAKADDDIKISPSARRLAEEKGVDLASVTGTGPQGRIVKADIDKAEGGSPAAAPAPTAKAPAAPAADGERIKASPLARRLAEQNGLDLGQLSGSGPHGRIVKADIEAALESGAGKAPAKEAPAAPVDTDIPHEAIKLSNMRKTIAKRLTASKQEVPHYRLSLDCRLDPLLDLRKELNAGLEARGIKLSVNDLLIKALAAALEQVPDANVSFRGDQLLRYSRVDVSMAVAIEGGLITPVITDAGGKMLSKIATESKELAEKARDGKLQPHEYQGGTASISNLGMFGIKQFDAVINPPQAMIMAIGAGEKRAAVIDESLQIATIMSATGSFDHRAIDGAVGAQLMQAFQQLVENPLAMLA
ncbi:pyruvate dehydrogenase complex dihydrolipoamide acetyltransferase [Parasphingopyxis algicola]|uniref:2-oxo acid dehydrogenase subunit E2 n=1 Tax=Parasphingopyxis algicola TaxID=2026624 RepID=UPI00159FDEAC|nr:2-oxo acid dehydrogenase subunit E2 [Parasphingopyxis algicola]QLC26201.1 pyruvate dehydrogenase complex dihydrolipoamide acetyltransferase [Parasphingopyxis algicola]